MILQMSKYIINEYDKIEKEDLKCTWVKHK